MKSSFKHLDADGSFGALNAELEAAAGSPSKVNLLHEIENLAQSATAFFRGLYPREAPYFHWGSGWCLPWYDDYWREEGDRALLALPIAEEIAVIADAIEPLRSADEAGGPHTFFVRWPEGLRWTTQGLSVELLLCLDRVLALHRTGDYLRAIVVLSQAHHCLEELTIEAEQVLRAESEAGVVIQRIRQGASRGGRVSAERRRRDSAVPAADRLRAERDELVQSGKHEREVAGILARRYSCTADYIRKVLRE